MISRPKIVALDDDEATVRPLMPRGYENVVVSPPDISTHMTDFEEARLILIDHELFATVQPLSLSAQDGAGFVAQLRSWARRRGKSLPPVVILTNRPGAFATQIPAVGPAIEVGSFLGHEARIAPALDVEWLLFKDDDRVTDLLVSLAGGYSDIAAQVGTDGTSLKEVPTALRLPDAAVWKDRALEDIRRARPPISQLQKGRRITNDGPTEVIRWLCHRALAYPGLFISDLQAEWALGLGRGALAKIAKAPRRSHWLRTIMEAEYRGPV
jgi:hypothetical protein